MTDQSDAALTAVELFKAITVAMGDKSPTEETA
jgi:hypothetical protein